MLEISRKIVKRRRKSLYEKFNKQHYGKQRTYNCVASRDLSSVRIDEATSRGDSESERIYGRYSVSLFANRVVFLSADEKNYMMSRSVD